MRSPLLHHGIILIRKYLKEEELEKISSLERQKHRPLPMEPRECPYHDQNKGTDLTFMENVQSSAYL